MLNKNILSFLGCDAEYSDADIVLFGAPFDGTTSYRPGARFAPHAIRSESYGLETYSLYQDKDLADYSVFDNGDLELCFGDSEKVLSDIELHTGKILAMDKTPFMIGGEHLVTLGAVRAISAYYPEVCLIHFDAHADLRDDYLGVKLSHATVMRRCHEILGDKRIFQFGIRSGDKSEFAWNEENHTYLNPFNFDNLAKIIASLKGKPIYLSVDLDVLDPSVFPGTGTPEPGGVSFEQLRKAVTTVCQNCYIVGCDAVELSPTYDQSGASTAVAGKIVREMLLALC